MGIISLQCPTCRGVGILTYKDFSISCIPCKGSGGVLVHTMSISGTRANRVITDDPWDKVWEQLDLFEG